MAQYDLKLYGEHKYRIFVENRWARNSPGEPFIALDNRPAPIPSFETWVITKVSESGGYWIQNEATGLYVHADGPETGTPLRLDNTSGVWYIQTAGEGNYHVSYPDHDSLWTSVIRPGSREFNFVLRNSRGTRNQQITLEKIV